MVGTRRRTMTVSDQIVIATDPVTVYREVADPAQMGRWSPENTGAEIATAGRPAPIGTTFVGTNRRGRARWVTECVVTHSDPGVRFAFDVRRIGVRRPVIRSEIATWDYLFEAVEGGTRVTEWWTDGRAGWPDPVAAAFDKVATGGMLFADFQRRNIARTLAALRSALESPPPS